MKSFKEAKSKESLVTMQDIKLVLDASFNDKFKLHYRQDSDYFSGIDFFAESAKRSLSIDLKVRDHTKNKTKPNLIVEKEWKNCNKTSWLEFSKAEYFMFAHVFTDCILFFLLKSDKLRDFCAKFSPKKEIEYKDLDNTVAILAIYDYLDYFNFDKTGKVILLNKH